MPGRAVQEERVVRVGGQLRDRQGGRVGEAVALADHELVEGVLGVQPVARGRSVADRRRGRARRSRPRRRPPSGFQSAPTTSTSACASKRRTRRGAAAGR